MRQTSMMGSYPIAKPPPPAFLFPNSQCQIPNKSRQINLNLQIQYNAPNYGKARCLIAPDFDFKPYFQRLDFKVAETTAERASVSFSGQIVADAVYEEQLASKRFVAARGGFYEEQPALSTPLSPLARFS